MSKESDDLFAMFLGASQDEIKDPPYIRAPFPWVGGKWQSLEHLIRHLPVREAWLDGCGGSGVVTLNRRLSKLEIFNDRHSGVVAFYRVLRDPDLVRRFIDRTQTLLFAKEEFYWCRDTWEQCTDNLERAARWYYMLRTSFGGLGRNFGRSINGANGVIRAYSSSIELLPTISRRFAGVQVDNLDVIKCLQDYESAGLVAYVDPDYVDTHVGTYDNVVDHNRLLDEIKRNKSFIAVSGYANSLYDRQSFWDERFEWKVNTTIKPTTFNDANGLTGKQNVMHRTSADLTEVLWIKEAC